METIQTRLNFYRNEFTNEMEATICDGTYKILIDDPIVSSNGDTSEWYIVMERLQAAFIVIDTKLFSCRLSSMHNHFERIDFSKFDNEFEPEDATRYLLSINWMPVHKGSFSNENTLKIMCELMEGHFPGYFKGIN